MSQIILVVWRETVEALVVIGILYAWMKSNHAFRGLLYLWIGVAFGLLISIASAVVLLFATELFSDELKEYLRLISTMVSCVLIIHMVFWMQFRGRDMKYEMESSVDKFTQGKRWWKLTLLVALAIAREGGEIVIFVCGVAFSDTESTVVRTFIGVALGISLAALTFFIFQIGRKLFSWKIFFYITEIVLLFLAAGLFQSAVDQLIGMEWLPSFQEQIWDTSWILYDCTKFGSFIAVLTGYRATPSLMNVFAYLLYWISIFFLRSYIPFLQKVKLKNSYRKSCVTRKQH